MIHYTPQVNSFALVYYITLGIKHLTLYGSLENNGKPIKPITEKTYKQNMISCWFWIAEKEYCYIWDCHRSTHRVAGGAPEEGPITFRERIQRRGALQSGKQYQHHLHRHHHYHHHNNHYHQHHHRPNNSFDKISAVAYRYHPYLLIAVTFILIVSSIQLLDCDMRGTICENLIFFNVLSQRIFFFHYT